MWRTKKPEEPQPRKPEVPQTRRPEEPQPASFVKEVPTPMSPEPTRFEPIERVPGREEGSHVAKSLTVKGEIIGQENLYVDGEVEGNIELSEFNLTVGPQGRVHADVHAREITIHGKVQGNIRASERIEIKKSGHVTGDLVTARIVIEDGAFFKGSIDIQKPEEKEKARAAAADYRMSATPIALETKNKLQ